MSDQEPRKLSGSRVDKLIARMLDISQTFKIGGVQVTPTAAEFNVLAAVTPGTAAASKAVVLDANKDASGVRTLTFSGDLIHSGIHRQTKSAPYTMAEGDSGQVTQIDTDGVVITLPATVAGMTFTLQNIGADGAVGFSVSPAALDKIMGAGLTSADDKDLINTKATAKKWDRVTLVGDGVNGWFVQDIRGTWAREG